MSPLMRRLWTPPGPAFVGRAEGETLRNVAFWLALANGIVAFFLLPLAVYLAVLTYRPDALVPPENVSPVLVILGSAAVGTALLWGYTHAALRRYPRAAFWTASAAFNLVGFVVAGWTSIGFGGGSTTFLAWMLWCAAGAAASAWCARLTLRGLPADPDALA